MSPAPLCPPVVADVHPLSYAMMKRGEIREKFGIEGDGMGDCCTAYWCPCCTLIQNDKEVAARLPEHGVIQQGYQAQSGMAMPGAPKA